MHEHARQSEQSAAGRPVRCAVLTISDTRTPQTDRSGDRIGEIVREFGHEVIARVIVRDEPDAIRPQIEAWLSDSSVEAILTTGGTGVARRDTTIEVVRDLLTVELTGFGELFRMLSWEEVGSAAMLSRAVGGMVIRTPERGGDTIVFAMPGSVNAVDTAMRKLIAPELAHLRWERER